jgi:MFS family permease
MIGCECSSDSGSDDDSFDMHDYNNLLTTHQDRDVDPNPNNAPVSINTATAKPASSNLWLSMMRLYRMPVYSNLLGAMTALYFTVTGVQYWGTTYLSVTLNAPLPLVNLLFILCAATGPTLGVFFGGWFIDVIGGYRGMRQRTAALELCCMFGFFGCCFAIPVTLFNDVYFAVGFLWAVLFMGASILPACSGMLVSIVPRRHRPLSQSITLIVCNMFGYSASLLVSGYLMQVSASLIITYSSDLSPAGCLVSTVVEVEYM